VRRRAASAELLVERVGDTLTEGLGVVDDVDGVLLQDLVDVLRGGRTLDIIVVTTRM
jgi:hypothetical protein